MKKQPPISTSTVFLQLVGSTPDSSWFLHAVEIGLFSGKTPSSAARRYRQMWQVPVVTKESGLISSNQSMGRILDAVRRKAAGTPEDTSVIFCVEPLLAGAAIGLFALISLVQTGMRVGELMQVSLDKDCMEVGTFPQHNDVTNTWQEGARQIFWRLYPKGSSKRERYWVTPQMLEAMFSLLDLHKRCFGPDSVKPVMAQPASRFGHSRRYTDKHRFILQWRGQHLSRSTLQSCLTFLLLEHPCRDSAGKPTRITHHILRHGVAGWLRSQGVPLEDIMALLKQVNIAVTDYYSKLSPPDLFNKIGPALTALAELAGMDPSTIRTVGDIRSLQQEALKCFGALRHTPGGTCAVFTACAVQFQCAGCPHYIPDPSRREEVQEKIASCSQAVRLFTELGDYLQADNQKSYRLEWERVQKEMDALAAVELMSPPAESVMQDLGVDDLGAELLQSLEELSRRLPGGSQSNA